MDEIEKKYFWENHKPKSEKLEKPKLCDEVRDRATKPRDPRDTTKISTK